MRHSKPGYTGKPMRGSEKCSVCDGTGFDKLDNKYYDHTTPCWLCNGSGKMKYDRCPQCDGAGEWTTASGRIDKCFACGGSGKRKGLNDN